MGNDPFEALIDNRAARATWTIGGLELTERVARHSKASIRRRLLRRLRDRIGQAGGTWARLAPYPFPYRSAFNLRIDLDEPEPDDYARFARARGPLEDCVTHFVNTHAYGSMSDILRDLRRFDTQSHAHYHVVYRGEAANRRNVGRAHAILAASGFAPVGFAGPEGRWNPGLDRALEDHGYDYSTDFQLGYDDYPFFPWRVDGFSRVLQVPVHPICEGLFLEAGGDGRAVAAHLVDVVRARIAGGEPAFVYGHPERRLGRIPGVLAALADVIAGADLTWRVTLTEYARWWRWRSARHWSLLEKGPERFEIQFDDWDDAYPMALEIVRGGHMAAIPLTGPRQVVRRDRVLFERRRPRIDLPAPRPARPQRGLKAIVRAALDWETVTPIDDLPADSIAECLKLQLRRWRGGSPC
jgi:peptidoglycan/xylan/chitin deacetylase (PgdA/CDA1 family)